MKIPTPLNALSLLGRSLGLGLIFFSSVFSAIIVQQAQLPDTINIPVIFYDFHPNKTNDFEMCMNPGANGMTARPNMVLDSILLPDRKPIIGPSACDPASRATFPCACGLNEWFRPSGRTNAVKFEEYERILYGNVKTKGWRWAGLTRSTRYTTAKDTFWTGPLWDSTVAGANLVYYTTLPFILVDRDKAMYRFDRRSSRGSTRPNNPFFWLDGKGFGNEPGTTHNFAFTMELHHEFTYKGGETFNFSGDDDVWVFINNKLVLDLGGVHNETPGAFGLDTLADRLGLKKEQKYILDVFYAERHTTESNCLIETNLIRPEIDTFLLKVDANTLCPGQAVKITGSITDKAGVNLTQVEDSIAWEIVQSTDNDTNDRLIEKKGKITHLTATKAWRTLEVKGSVADPYSAGKILVANVKIDVIPCKAHHIVIESSDNPDKNIANPLLGVNIGPEQTEWIQCYAVVRDSFNNLFSLTEKFTSPNTKWTSDNIQIATVSGETNKAYHGIVLRVKDGTTKVTASDGNLIPDDVPVTISNYYYDTLRLIDLKTNKILDTLKLETDSIGNYKIQGHKSTSGSDYTSPDSWEDCTAKLQLLDTLKSTKDTSLFTHKWIYDPTNHGRGRVVLSIPNEPKTRKATVPVIITLSPPQFSLKLITPEAKRIAGDTLLVEVSIANTDGLIPIAYCFNKNGNLQDSISYFDNLGRGGANKPEPYIIVDGVKTVLNYDNERYRNGQCFAPGGKDTIKMVLFYAPFNPGPDSLHTLSLSAGPRSAKTDPFTLLPGPLYTLKFEDQNWIQYPDSIEMNHENQVFSTYSNGYDKYGNRRGHEPSSNWSVTGDLDPSKLGNVFGESSSYRTNHEIDGSTGFLVAKAKGIHDSIIVATLKIKVTTPPSPISSVYTRDISGNGLLDRIDLTFTKRTKFSLDDGNIEITNLSTHTQFSIDSIIPVPNGGDSAYYIYIHETDTTKPQTAWTPTLILNGFAEAANVSGRLITDGAAPVVWKAEKLISPSLDTKKDVVTITLSEPIETGGNLGLVTVESDPPNVFRIWEKNGNGDYVVEDLLKGIDNFTKINEETFEFTMKNGKEITDGNYVNIISENKAIADENSNFTHERNQKVKFKINGNRNIVEILPNPAHPVADGNSGKLEMIDRTKKDAFDLVNHVGGAIIRITVVRPSDTTKLKITVKVYDVAGNQVIWAKNDDVFKDHYNKDTSNIVYLHYYWNCTNSRGMKVAPGRYKFIAWFDYNSPMYKDEKIALEMGVKK